MTAKTPLELQNAIRGARFSRHEEKALLDLIDTFGGTAEGNAPGAGIIAGTGTVAEVNVSRVGRTITTEIFIDLTGLDDAATLGDIIGDSAGGVAYITQITDAINGSIYDGTMTCLEVPTTGVADVDLEAADEGTGEYDAAVGGLTNHALLAAGGAWTLGETKDLTDLPDADEYLYLVSGAAPADDTYDAGQFLIRLQGRATSD